MNKSLTLNAGTVVLNDFTDGVNIVQSGTPLKFVNYFDGMLMRAETMKLEQQGRLSLSQLSNQAGGHGVVWGFDSTLSGAGLEIGAGMAINTEGRVVYLPNGIELSIDELINKSDQDTRNVDETDSDGFSECEIREPGDTVTIVEGTQYYVITVDHLQALCGEEDVYGRLCEEACITATDRPYQLDGVVIRAEALPSNLILPESNVVSLSGTHLRSRMASAFYEYERNSIASHISGEGLAQGIWCNGAELPGGFTRGVPIALLARQGSETVFLDRWIVTRERMQWPPRNYWAHRMAMRPWNQFLAQVLQFQCQINNLFGVDGIPVNPDPCAQTKQQMKSLSNELEEMLHRYSAETPSKAVREEVELNAELTEPIQVERSPWISQIEAIQRKLAESAEPSQSVKNRILISGGIVETPSGGYLPVDTDSPLSVNEQVRKLMGEGVDLRFCIVRPDFIPHALEEAQHMERISLLEGLDDPSNKPKVDVLVPDGVFGESQQDVAGIGYDMELDLYEALGDLVDALFDDSKPAMAEEVVMAEQPDIEGESHLKTIESIRRNTGAPEKALNAIAYDGQKPFATLQGVGRGSSVSNNGLAFAYAGFGQTLGVSSKARNDRLVGVEDIRDTPYEIETRGIGLWTAMAIDEDPFDMQMGESTSASSEIDLVVYDKDGGRFRSNASINIKLVSKVGDRLELMLTGDAQISLINSKGRQDRNVSLNQSAMVQRQSSQGRSYTIASIILSAALRNSRGLRLDAARKWIATDVARFSLVGSAASRQGREMGGMRIADANQKVDKQVLNPTHPRYAQAYSGLNLISDFARQPSLTEIRAKKLFDGEAGNASDQSVSAVHDWVFFHRRRDKQCVSDIATPVNLDRPYRVFMVEVSNAEHAKVLLEAILSQNYELISEFKLREITDVNFAANSASIKTSQQAILSDWNLKVNDNLKIHSGVIANHPDWNEPESLATARLAQLNQIIDDETQFSDAVDFHVLSSLLPSFEPLGKGAVTYIVEPISTTCHTVFRMPRTDNVESTLVTFKSLLVEAQSLEELIKNLDVEFVGEISYIEQTDQFFDQQEFNKLEAQWQTLENGPISAVISLSQSTQFRDAILAQSIQLGKALDNSSSFAQMAQTTSLTLTDCNRITFIVPGYVSKNSVVRFNGVVPDSMMFSLEEALANRGSREVMADSWAAGETIRFNDNTGVIGANDIERATTRLISNVSLPENGQWRVISIHPKGASNEEISRIEKESATIAAAIGDDIPISKVTDTDEKLTNGVNGLTVIVPVDTGKKHSVLPVSVSSTSGKTGSEPDAVFYFNEDDELVKDEQFEKQIAQLKRKGLEFSEAQIVGKAKPRSNDKRLSEVFEALKENDLMTSGAEKRTSKLKENELGKLDVGSFRMSEALVLKLK